MDYRLEMERIVAELAGKKPTLLLHSCCAPCSSAVLETLTPHFTVTVDYYNPNIDPPEEYSRRAEEQQRYVQEVYGSAVPVVQAAYDPQEFYSAVRGLEALPEGSERCFACYRLRMEHTARAAKQQGFAFFTTTLSISPHKNAQKLNELGYALEAELGVRYLPADFKKREGFKRSGQLSAQHGLYRQDYCGCVFSRNARAKQDAARGQNAQPVEK